MNGGLIFSGKLLPKLNFPLELSYLHATRYRNETSGGELFWKAKPELSFMDRDVLIIDRLNEGEASAGELVALVGTDASTVSKHLSILRAHGIVEDRRAGASVFYRLLTPCVLKFFACATQVLRERR